MADLDTLIPDPLNSDRQYTRFYHLDLPDLDDTGLTDELNHLRPLLWALDPQHWLRGRVKALESEKRRRGFDARYEPSRQPKPKPAAGVKL